MARATTGHNFILKVEGSYHGQHESVCISFNPSLEEDIGPANAPKAFPSHPGVPKEMQEYTKVIPFNCSREIIEEQMSKVDNKIACIILEPILMNCAIIPAHPEFLRSLRQICSERNIYLIFDEVKTNTTVGIGGAVEAFGIVPDMICLGKSISGGIPFGAVGMTEEISEQVKNSNPSINSTFGGNPLAVACCLATLNEIMTPDAYKHIAKLQEMLKNGLEKLLSCYSIEGRVIIYGAKGCLLFMDHIPVNYRDWKENNSHAFHYALHSFFLNSLIWMSGSGEEWTISVAHTEDDISYFLQVTENFFTTWRENSNKN